MLRIDNPPSDTARPAPPARPSADWPDELRVLLGPDATNIVGAVVERAGGTILDITPRQVNHQPGRSTTVQYRAQVRWDDGSVTAATYVATKGHRLPEGTTIVEPTSRPGDRVAVWDWRDDPALPGLGPALDVGSVATLLTDLGYPTAAQDQISLVTRAYRPGRRAVIQVVAADRSVYLKVVRPATVQALHDTHRLIAPLMPSPGSLGWSSDGILVMPSLPGVTLRSMLRSGSQHAPAPRAVFELLDRLPEGLLARPRRSEPIANVAHHAATIASIAPWLGDTLDGLTKRLGAIDDVDHEVVPVHGDLYEAQLLCDAGRFSGLLDLDTAGPGHRINDLANFCAHLSVLATTAANPAPINRYGAAILASAETVYDRRDVRSRIAAYVIGLATGPFRVLEPDWMRSTQARLELAAHWLKSARAGR